MPMMEPVGGMNSYFTAKLKQFSDRHAGDEPLDTRQVHPK
jgi:hypothetical protein